MIFEKALSTINEYRMLESGQNILVAVSGGCDSMALLDFLLRQEEFRLSLTIFHFNHHLRGEESLRDQEFVRTYCGRLNLPFEVREADVKAFCEANKYSPEEGARILRYRALEEVAVLTKADRIALAHHADDQLETFMMRTLTGASLEGFAAIPPVRGVFIRPFIEITKKELEDYCHANNLEFKLDTTNLSLDPFRNRVRWELLPLLDPVKPGWRKALLSSIKLLRQDADYFQAELSLLEQELIISSSDISISMDLLKNLHPALSGRLLRKAASKLGSFLESRHIAQIQKFIHAGASFRLHLPGKIEILNAEDRIILRKRNEQSADSFSISAGEYGIYPIPYMSYEAELVITSMQNQKIEPEPFRIYVDSKKLGFPLVVRSLQPGDRFKPLGMQGKSKKVHDLLIDRKIPKEQRQHLFVVESSGEIVWVAGVEVSDAFKLDKTTTEIVKLEIINKENSE